MIEERTAHVANGRDFLVAYKLKTGWAVVQIATDKQPWMVLFLPQ